MCQSSQQKIKHINCKQNFDNNRNARLVTFWHQAETQREIETHTTQPSKYVMQSQICTMFPACTHPNALVVYYTLFRSLLAYALFGSFSFSLAGHRDTRTHIKYTAQRQIHSHFGAATLKTHNKENGIIDMSFVKCLFFCLTPINTSNLQQFFLILHEETLNQFRSPSWF